MGTTTLRQLKSDFYRYQGEHWSGTATGGSTTKLTDSTLIDLANEEYPFPVENKQLRITSGAADGDLRRIAKADHTVGDLYAARAFSSTGPASTHTYEIWGASPHGGTPLTNIFNDVLRRLRYLTMSKLTIKDRRGVYDISTLVTRRQEVSEVYFRTVDTTLTTSPTGNLPYRQRAVDSWEARDALAVATATLTISGTPTGGHYHVFLGGDDSGEIDYNASAATLQTALRTLFGLESATVTATGSTPNFTHTITLPTDALETPFTVDDSALTGGSSPTVTPATATTRYAVLLYVYPEQTAAVEPNIQGTEIWLEYWAPFTAFTADTSTIQDIYRDWLVWETIVEWARQKMGQETDRKRWTDLAIRALREARLLRQSLFEHQHYRPNHAWHFKGQ